MRTVLDTVFRWIQPLVGLIFLVIFILFVLQICLRYFAGIAWLWTPDAVRLLFIWGVFLGMAVLFHLKAHLTMDYFVEKLAPTARQRLDIILDLAAAAFFLILLVKGWEIADRRMRVPFDTWDFPTGYAYAAAPICAALMLASVLERIISAVRGRNDIKEKTND